MGATSWTYLGQSGISLLKDSTHLLRHDTPLTGFHLADLTEDGLAVSGDLWTRFCHTQPGQQVLHALLNDNNNI